MKSVMEYVKSRLVFKADSTALIEDELDRDEHGHVADQTGTRRPSVVPVMAT